MCHQRGACVSSIISIVVAEAGRVVCVHSPTMRARAVTSVATVPVMLWQIPVQGLAAEARAPARHLYSNVTHVVHSGSGAGDHTPHWWLVVEQPNRRLTAASAGRALPRRRFIITMPGHAPPRCMHHRLVRRAVNRPFGAAAPCTVELRSSCPHTAVMPRASTRVMLPCSVDDVWPPPPPCLGCPTRDGGICWYRSCEVGPLRRKAFM